MRYTCTIIFLILSAYVHAQGSFIFNKKNVNIDSVFLSGSYALSLYNNHIDSAIFATKQSIPRTTLVYIKALKFLTEDKPVESNRLLTYCMMHIDSMSSIARLKIYFSTGINLISMNETYEGLQYMSRADSLAEICGNPNVALHIKGYYAEVNRNIGKLDRSKEILESGMRFLKDGTWRLRVNFLWGYITTFNQLAVEKKDISWASRANSITDTLLNNPQLAEDPSLYASLLAEKGSSLSILKKHHEAISFFQRAQVLLIDIYPAGAFNQDINLFHEYYNLQDYKKIIEYGEKILLQFDEFDELSGRKIEIHQRLSDAYEETGNYQKALHHTHILITEKERSDQLKYSKDLAELEEKYKASQKDEQIRIAGIQKEASEKEARSKEKQLSYTILACIVFGSLLVIALVLALLFNLAKKRILQQAKDLEIKNGLLDTAVKEKDFLFKELHHRVKNNIQLIISFMKLQYKYSSTTPLEVFIREIENKMNAMALVHEKLYKGNTQEYIELKEYVEDIVGYILDSITHTDNVPEINMQGGDTKIFIDKAIPVGLIINEIVTNSIKHGYTSKQEGREINIMIDTRDKNLCLTIQDNGKGFPSNFDPEKTTSLGTKAILLLAKQIHAHISWSNNGGAQWQLVIPLNNP